MDYQSIAIQRIDEPRHRLRETIEPQALGELADSMAAEGLHQPIGVRGPLDGDRYEIVYGHRRLLAARLLRWATIDARVFDRDFDPLLAAVSENLQRADLNPLEEADAVARFRERGHAVAMIARLFRRSTVWVQSRLELLDYPADIRAAIGRGELKLALARTLAEIDHAPYREELTREAIRSGATSAIVEVWRAHYFSDRDRIVANGATIQEIAERRALFRIVFPCDWCAGETDYEQSGTVRLCGGCHRELLEARDRAVRETARV